MHTTCIRTSGLVAFQMFYCHGKNGAASELQYTQLRASLPAAAHKPGIAAARDGAMRFAKGVWETVQQFDAQLGTASSTMLVHLVEKTATCYSRRMNNFLKRFTLHHNMNWHLRNYPVLESKKKQQSNRSKWLKPFIYSRNPGESYLRQNWRSNDVRHDISPSCKYHQLSHLYPYRQLFSSTCLSDALVKRLQFGFLLGLKLQVQRRAAETERRAIHWTRCNPCLPCLFWHLVKQYQKVSFIKQLGYCCLELEIQNLNSAVERLQHIASTSSNCRRQQLGLTSANCRSRYSWASTSQQANWTNCSQ